MLGGQASAGLPLAVTLEMGLLEARTLAAPGPNWVTLAGSLRVRSLPGRHAVLVLGQGRLTEAIGRHLGEVPPNRTSV